MEQAVVCCVFRTQPPAPSTYFSDHADARVTTMDAPSDAAPKSGFSPRAPFALCALMCCVALHYIAFCCALLCCVVLCCAVLCCFVLFLWDVWRAPDLETVTCFPPRTPTPNPKPSSHQFELSS